MKATLEWLLWRIAFYSFALFNFFLYLGLSLRSGSLFKRRTERDKLQLAIARDDFWNLSKLVAGLSHRFCTLRNGLKLHYLTNCPNAADVDPAKPLVILLHGFPDSCVQWKDILRSEKLQQHATLVAVDLPGYGGSDSFKLYDPDNVLEALAEFAVAMRERYVDLNEIDSSQAARNERQPSPGKVYIVGHDWGCVLAYRLAAEAPCLANRYVLTNGPLVPLALENKDRILNSARKMFNTFLHAPLANRTCLTKAFNTTRPLLFQLLLFGYIAAFQLPDFLVKYLGTAGNYAFLRGAHVAAHGQDKSGYILADSMACTTGPGVMECKTETMEKEHYGRSVLHRAQNPGTAFLQQIAYYRDGASVRKWNKSIHTVAALHNIETDNENRYAKSASFGAQLRKHRSPSSSSPLFETTYKGALKAPATIMWGQQDQACTQKICLEGVGDYLAQDSQVMLLPRSGHWTTVEKESRKALQALIEWLVDGGEEAEEDVEMVLRRSYPGCKVLIRK